MEETVQYVLLGVGRNFLSVFMSTNGDENIPIFNI